SPVPLKSGAKHSLLDGPAVISPAVALVVDGTVVDVVVVVEVVVVEASPRTTSAALRTDGDPIVLRPSDGTANRIEKMVEAAIEAQATANAALRPGAACSL